MPLVQRLFSFENFSLFFGKDLEIIKKKKKLNFFLILKKYIYINTQTKLLNAT